MGKEEREVRPEISVECEGRWKSILPRFGIAAGILNGRQHPCPMCGGRDRFRFDNKQGRGTFFCNQCGAGDGVKLVMLKTGSSFERAAESIRECLPGSRKQEVRAPNTAKLLEDRRKVWANAKQICPQDDAGRYLASRGIQGPYSPALRFTSDLACNDDNHPRLPAMLALVRDGNGEACNIHRTYLLDGQKAPISSVRRMMPGQMGDGFHIRLMPGAAEMGIAEGIETALRAADIFKMPVWSCISSGGIIGFQPPAGILRLWIYADNDAKYGGQSAAYQLAHRLATRTNIEVKVKIPDTIGSDWAD